MRKNILMEVQDMCKYFGPTVALNHVNFKIYSGEIRGLIGENGSGKSTVSSIIAGMQPASSGKMLYKGEEYKPVDTFHAIENGIGMIVQEAGTVTGISIAENIFLGMEKKFRRVGRIVPKLMEEEAKKALEAIGITDMSPEMPIDELDMQERKLVEVARVCYSNPEILIVDETTTALSQHGRDIIYKIMDQYASEGKAVLFISHDIEELMEKCTTLTVLRDGNIIVEYMKEEFDADSIKKNMVGRELSGNYYRTDHDGYDEDDVVLSIKNLTTAETIMNFNLELHRGEVLGIGGLSECGMHILGRAIYGLEQILTGTVTVHKKGTKITSPEIAMKAGIGYVSKNRDTESLVLNAGINDNIASTGFEANRIAGVFISMKKEKRFVQKQIDGLRIKCSYPGQYVQYLSGGNKQKVVFGKWVGKDSDILILDCPTRGVDVGVKQAMYQLIYDMKKAGKSILMISEELPELIGMSDRLIIMKDGRQSREFMRGEAMSESTIINYMI